MAKVKFFDSCDRGVLMYDINDFIADKKLIDIKFNSITVHTDCGPAVNDRILIIYED